MLETYFDKGRVKTSTFKPEQGDSFGMDLDSKNFPAWRDRQPKADTSETAVEAAASELREANNGEFRPIALDQSPARALTNREKALVDGFRKDTLRALRIISGGGPDEDEESDLSGSVDSPIAISASDYMFSASHSVLCTDVRTGAISQIRGIVGFYEIRDEADLEADKCWLVPDLPGHNRTAENDGEGPGAAPPERFRSGPVSFAHVLRSMHGQPDTLEDSLALRFSEAAFREAVEHFVGKHAGVPELREPYSHVDFMIRATLEAAHGAGNVEIDAIDLVESRQNGTVVHFTLSVDVDGKPEVEDVGIYYTANGTIQIERL